MKPHVIVKMHRAIDDGVRIPHWVDFISDKSQLIERAPHDVHGALSSRGIRYWVTREYASMASQPTAEECAEGLERTYRLIFQDDYALSPNLIEDIRLRPSVESARAIDVGLVELPDYVKANSLDDASMPPLARRGSDLIGLPYARAVTRGSQDVKIAILDTGADLDHPELRGKIGARADFVNLEGLDTSEFVGDFVGYDAVPEDEVGHGTHVSGIVAGRGLNMNEGVAPDCRLMIVRVLASLRSGERRVGAGIVDNINAGIKWAVDHGADVINMSLGIKHTGGGLPHEDIVRYALRKNVAVVAASGNDGTRERYYPGALPGVFAVGAVDDAGNVAGFTSYGANIFVVAPGTEILSSFAHGGYASASGTSQAAPFVSGAVGLFKSYARERGAALTNSDVADVLRSTSDKVDTRLRNILAGYGLINLSDALKLLANRLS